MRYTFKGYIDDMGSYSTTATANRMETAVENALWSFNSARQHDGLPDMTLDKFKKHIRHGNIEIIPAEV